MTSQLINFDGIVVEDSSGGRILAIPTAVLEPLRNAAVVRYRRGESVYSMRLSDFLDGRRGGQLVPHVEAPAPAGSAPTPDYGAPALPVHGAHNPSPTPPPAHEPTQTDPADIPVYVKRGGAWEVKHVTRAQYQRYKDAGRISQEAPGLAQEDPETEGTEQ